MELAAGRGARRAVWVADFGTDAGAYGGGGVFAGTGDWGEHGDFQFARCSGVAAAAGAQTGRVDANQDARRRSGRITADVYESDLGRSAGPSGRFRWCVRMEQLHARAVRSGARWYGAVREWSNRQRRFFCRAGSTAGCWAAF